jgi:hypothetical protein
VEREGRSLERNTLVENTLRMQVSVSNTGTVLLVLHMSESELVRAVEGRAG